MVCLLTPARRAAARIVDTLTGADRFAVLCFDNVTEQPPALLDGLADGLAEATDKNRFRAVEWLARTDARGGTEMLAPLERAESLPRSAILVFAKRVRLGGVPTKLAEPDSAPVSRDRDRPPLTLEPRSATHSSAA